MTSTITNENGQLRSVTGEHGMEAFTLRTLIVMLKSEQRGLRFRVSALKAAKRVTGLKTNDRAAQIAAIQPKLDAALAKCEIVDAGAQAEDNAYAADVTSAE